MIQCRESDPKNRSELTDRLQRLIREELGIGCIIELVPRNTLIRTTSGKPSRHGTRKVYLARIAANPGIVQNESPCATAVQRHAV